MILRAPVLSACSNFNQAWAPEKLAHSAPMVRDYRDGMFWAQVETTLGEHVYDQPTTTYPTEIAAADKRLSVMIQSPNPLYDGGVTPYTPEGVEAFGHFAASIVRKYPNVHSIEVMNEFNAQNFISGPLKAMQPFSDERVAGYFELLKSVATKCRAVRRSVKILGGATHSLPTLYLWKLFDLGARAYMDALALHPYTTIPEAMVEQIKFMRRHPSIDSMPIEITEFGAADETRAARMFAKLYSQYSLSGASRVSWYQMHDRGDGFAPLYLANGTITAVGRAYKFAQDNLVGKNASPLNKGPGTYGTRFGLNIFSIWGEPRAISVRNGAEAYDSRGEKITTDADMYFDEERLLYIVAPTTIAFGSAGNVVLAPAKTIADSRAHFRFPIAREYKAAGDVFERFFRDKNGLELPLPSHHGQSPGGGAWFPSRWNKDVGVKNETHIEERIMIIQALCEVVHRYTAPKATQGSLVIKLIGRPNVPMQVIVRKNDAVVAEGEAVVNYDNTLPVNLALGDALEVVVRAPTLRNVIDYRISFVK